LYIYSTLELSPEKVLGLSKLHKEIHYLGSRSHESRLKDNTTFGKARSIHIEMVQEKEKAPDDP